MILTSWQVVAGAADNAEENRNRDGKFSADLQLERVASSEINGFGMSFLFTEFSARMRWRFLLLDLDHREYHWQGNSVAEPWEKLTQIAPGLQYYREFRNRWGLWLKFVAIAGYEDTLSPQSWSYNPQILGLSMIPARRMTLYGGVGTLYHPAYSITYPVLGVTWNINSAVGISAALGFPETMVRYGFNERLAIKADFQWDIRTYHLSQDNTLAPGGYVKTEELKPGVRIEYKLAAAVTLSIGARIHSGRSMTIFDRRKKELTYRQIDTSPAFSLGFDYQY